MVLFDPSSLPPVVAWASGLAVVLAVLGTALKSLAGGLQVFVLALMRVITALRNWDTTELEKADAHPLRDAVSLRLRADTQPDEPGPSP